uniref:Uncharacterized protein n=1 Tax=Rhodosorus marinus TaxID=101924 RepID=A0A7S3EBB4_9RHOD|mmetsp:Transcript_22520/g.90290  ORF Transcript_22520/g.90290 Transcript_22520/m.90290 type:complete len:236 (+) Transcript_22520:198-905(+)
MEREEGWKEAMSVEKRKREEREGSLARAGPVQRRRRFDYELVETVVPLPEWDERTFRMRVEAEIQKYAAPQSRIRKSTAARTNMNGEVLQMYSCSIKRCSMRMRTISQNTTVKVYVGHPHDCSYSKAYSSAVPQPKFQNWTYPAAPPVDTHVPSRYERATAAKPAPPPALKPSTEAIRSPKPTATSEGKRLAKLRPEAKKPEIIPVEQPTIPVRGLRATVASAFERFRKIFLSSS